MTATNNAQIPDNPLPVEAQKLLKRLEGRAADEIFNTEALKIVRVLWPEAFNVVSPKPLKIGIHKDMVATHWVPDHIISRALRFFTSLDRYLSILKPGTPRVDLNGKQAGKVKLREAVDAEIKRYEESRSRLNTRERIIIKKIRLMSVNKPVS